MTKERVRPCPGFEGWYTISDHGTVRRVKPAQRVVVGRALKPYTDKKGYRRVQLSKDCKHYERRVHRLVAAAFIGPCPPDKEVDHKDRCRSNNHYKNLRYLTHTQNMKRSLRWPSKK